MTPLSRFFIRLRWKLMLWYSGITLVTILAAGFVAGFVSTRNMLYSSSFLGELLTAETERLSRILTPHIGQNAGDFPGIISDALQETPRHRGELVLDDRNTVAVYLFDSHGIILGAFPDPATVGTSIRTHLPPEGDVAVNDILFDSGRGGERNPADRHFFAGNRLRNTGFVDPMGLLVEYRPNLRDAAGMLSGVTAGPLLSLGFLAVTGGLLFGFLAAFWITRRLRRFTVAAESWSRADFSVQIDDRSEDELGVLARNLNRTAIQLRDLLETRGELAAVEERNRVARELHDSVKQHVFAASLQVAAARERVGARVPQAAESLERAETLTRNAGRDLGRLIRELRPAELENQGLVAALRDHAARWSLESGIESAVHAQGERPTPIRIEQEMFRIAQEALTNVRRHSDASHVDVRLQWGESSLTVRIADNGRGMRPGSKPGWGVQTMRERIEALGGELQIGSERGTEVTAFCPLPRNMDGDTGSEGGRP